MAETEEIERLKKALEEQRLRIEAERRLRVDAEERTQAAKESAEAAKESAEAAKESAEEDRRLRAAAEKRERDAEQRQRDAEQRQRDAEQRQRDAEQRQRDAEARFVAEQQLRIKAEGTVTPADYQRFLSMCHDNLYANLVILEDPKLVAAGTFTNVDDKYYPLCLKPWAEFLSLHEQCHGKLASLFKDSHVFPSIRSFQAIDDLMPNDVPLADEDGVRQLQYTRVESCVRRVLIQYLKDTKAAASPANNDVDQSQDEASASLPMRIYFTNSPYGILVDGPEDSDKSQQSDMKPAYKAAMLQVQQKDAAARGRLAGDKPPPAKRIASPVRKIHPDKWLMRENKDGSIAPIFVVEYKAAHKLRGSAVELAFSNTTREPYGLFAAVMREQWQNKVVQDDKRLKTQQYAEKAVALVIAQAFHYMVEFGLCYSYVSSGEALILLYLDAADARTLYYHVALPREEVGSGAAEDVRRSAVSLVTTLSLLALDKPPLSQRWKKKAVGDLRPWPVPYDEMHILFDSSDEEQERKLKDVPKLAPPGSQQSCSDATPQHRQRKDGDDDDDDDGDDHGNDRAFRPPRSRQTPSALAGRQYETRSKDKSNTKTSNPSHTTRQCAVLPYCSQTCVLGLRTGGRVDRSCPNVQLHPCTASGCHKLTAVQFCRQLRAQLADDLDENCDALDKFKKFGAIGMLFRLTLQGYGYCVVAKGVQRVHASRLEHEMAVYEHLRGQQAVLVPVCLGIVELVDVYRTAYGAHISHMLVLSYAGEIAGSKAAGPMPDDIDQQLHDAWFRLRQLGVRHGDERDPNILWDAAQQRVMCIDFEWSKIEQRKRKHAEEAQSPGASCQARADDGTPTKRLAA